MHTQERRGEVVTGKKRGGGVCMYINEAWCPRGNVTVIKHLNTCDVDLLSLSLRPRYLPREFGQVFVTCVYIPLGPVKHGLHSR